MSKIFKLLILGLICLPPTLLADTLEDIQQSAVINRFQKESNRSRIEDAKNWLPPGKNFSRVFSNLHGPQLLHSWLSIPTTAFKTKHEKSDYHKEYAKAQKRVHSAKSGAKFIVMVYVPHPRYEQMAKHNLIPDFAALEPPVLDVEYSEDYVVQGFTAELHQHKSETCSLLLKLDKASRIELRTNCKNNEEMVELAKVLTLKRFQTKVNS